MVKHPPTENLAKDRKKVRIDISMILHETVIVRVEGGYLRVYRPVNMARNMRKVNPVIVVIQP